MSQKEEFGRTSLDKVDEIATREGISMYEVIKNAAEFDLNRVHLATREFVQQIEEFTRSVNDMPVSALTQKILKETGYIKALELEDTKEAENRIDNLEEFITVTIEFEEEAEDDLGSFLENITLSSDVDELEEPQEQVTLMTLHSAKGLEFPIVFMAGMEEGVFPGNKAIGEPKGIEEERRLCYVGITRAREKLYMTCAKSRTIFGATSYNSISRFLKEIPEEFFSEESSLSLGEETLKGSFDNSSNNEWTYGNSNVKKYNINNTNSYGNAVAANSFSYRTPESFLNGLNRKSNTEVDITKYIKGARVYHKKFGEGTINYVEEEGDDYKVDINFDKVRT